jgi:hypothetical protein
MARIAGRRSSSREWRRRSALIACAFVLAVGSQSARATTLSDTGHAFASVGEDAFDLIVLRTTGMLAVSMGAVFFAATVPFVTPYHAFRGTTDGIRSSYDVFIYPPYEYTFLRELGDF